MRTPLLSLLAALIPLTVSAATHEEVMRSHYLKYNFCMQRAVGQYWWKSEQVAQGMNRWGVSESTESAIANASSRVRESDAACRKTNELQSEPRPSVQLREKNIPD